MRIIGSLFVLLVALTARAENPSFRPVQVVVEIENNADGTAVPVTAANYTYDDHNLVRFVTEWDRNRDGTLDLRDTSIFTYDKHDNLILRESETYSIADGTVESRGTATFTYDNQGNRVGILSKADFVADVTVNWI